MVEWNRRMVMREQGKFLVVAWAHWAAQLEGGWWMVENRDLSKAKVAEAGAGEQQGALLRLFPSFPGPSSTRSGIEV